MCASGRWLNRLQVTASHDAAGPRESWRLCVKGAFCCLWSRVLCCVQICFNYVTFYPVNAMPSLDTCIANTRKNLSTCATRTRLAAAVVANLTDVQQIRVRVTSAIAYCQLALLYTKHACCCMLSLD